MLLTDAKRIVQQGDLHFSNMNLTTAMLIPDPHVPCHSPAVTEIKPEHEEVIVKYISF